LKAEKDSSNEHVRSDTKTQSCWKKEDARQAFFAGATRGLTQKKGQTKIGKAMYAANASACQEKTKRNFQTLVGPSRRRNLELARFRRRARPPFFPASSRVERKKTKTNILDTLIFFPRGKEAAKRGVALKIGNKNLERRK